MARELLVRVIAITAGIFTVVAISALILTH